MVKQKLLIFFRWLLQLSTNLTSTQQVASCFLGVTTLHRQGNCKKTASNFAITEQRKISESDRLFFCNLYSKKRCCRSSY